MGNGLLERRVWLWSTSQYSKVSALISSKTSCSLPLSQLAILNSETTSAVVPLVLEDQYL